MRVWHNALIVISVFYRENALRQYETLRRLTVLENRYRHHKCGDGIQPTIIEQFLIKISTRT